MKTKRILVLLGNPCTDGYSAEVADTYENTAREAGHEVRRVNIGDLDFDPILHRGYRAIQELESDLKKMQEHWRWAEHIVIVYPNWWCTMPALLKGMFDRMYLPGFAFNFNKETKKIVKHLTGRTARVFILAGTHSPFMTWFKFGDYTNEITDGILGFSGIKAKAKSFGPTDRVGDTRKQKWLDEVRKLARAGK